MVTSSPAEGDITARLQPLADRLLALARPILKSAQQFGGDLESRDDARTEALASLFLMYIHLGGNPDLPHLFDWETKTKRLLWLSRVDLGRFMEGPGSVRYDWRRRNALRRGGMAAIHWDSWTEMPYTPGTSKGKLNEGALLKPEDQTGRASPAGMRETPQEITLANKVLEGLPEAVEAVVPPADYRLLSEHYLFGKSQAEMAGVEGVPVGAPERRRPETAINVALHRARRKARYGLSSFWAHLAQETA